MRRRSLVLSALIGLTALIASVLGTSLQGGAATPTLSGLHVVGNTLRNGSEQAVRLVGVNHSGTEYACIQGWGIFDGPSDAASIQAIATWGTNTIRVPLNEDCWLGVNVSGINTAYVGAAYRQAIGDYVGRITAAGMVAVLDLHWSAGGTTRASGQANMPDADYSPQFWSSVATTFKTNSAVVFDLFNEPFPDNNGDSAAGWTCWRDGGACGKAYDGSTFTAAGFQSLVNTVRATGATNVILLGGLQYSNALSQWLTYKPTDPTGNLGAAWHVYNFNLCSNLTCWQQKIGPVAAQVPLLAGEIGENDCGHGFIDTVMTYLDSIGANYLGWTWNTWDCGSGPALISDYSGTPTAFGVGLRDHLLALGLGVGSGGATTTTTTTTTTSTSTSTTAPTTTTTTTATTTTGGGGGSGLAVQVQYGGTEDSQQSQFHLQVANRGTSNLGSISTRVYLTLDGSQPASKYVMEKYWDQSGVAVISGPFALSSTVAYFTVTYTGATLAPGAVWQLHTALHLSDWAAAFSGGNDHWHTGYALGALPAAYTDQTYLPGYVAGTRVWGSEPAGGSTPTTTTATSTTTTASTTTASTTTTTAPTTTTTTGGSVGGVVVRIQNGGNDDTQQSQFRAQLVNTSTTAKTNLSYRIYFTLDGSQPASRYTLEKYWDESGGATITGPTLASGSTYYYTVSFGARSLAAGASWQLHTSLHLTTWATSFSAANDAFHAGYALGALPTAYTDTTGIPAFSGSTLLWGVVP